jgi:hypothetical protein
MKVTLLISFSVVTPVARLFDGRFAQERHAFLARQALDFRSRRLSRIISRMCSLKIQQFVDGGSAAESGAAAFEAARAFVEA